MSQTSKKINEVFNLRQQALEIEESIRRAVFAYLKYLTGLVDDTNCSGFNAVGKAFAPEVSFSYDQDMDIFTITYPVIINEFGDYGEDHFLRVYSRVLDDYLS